eukprot:scaffold115418_cov66-Attheya_sp.AAC.1
MSLNLSPQFEPVVTDPLSGEKLPVQGRNLQVRTMTLGETGENTDTTMMSTRRYLRSIMDPDLDIDCNSSMSLRDGQYKAMRSALGYY